MPRTTIEADRPTDHVDRILDEWRLERPDLDPTPMGIFGRVTRVGRLTNADLTRMLAPHGLTPGSFDVLANLRRAGDPYRKTPSELAESSMLTSGGMTNRLDKLQAQGLISRRYSDHDRRVLYAELTPEGLELIDRVIELHLARERQLLEGLAPDRRALLIELLAELETSVNEELATE